MKAQLVAAFITQLEHDLMAMKESAIAAREAATNEESKPENEYDTRAIEASYLAGAQAKRAGEIDQVLSLFRTLQFRDFKPTDMIESTAVVEVLIDGKPSSLLVMPKGGAMRLAFEGKNIQIVTPQSSLGEALIGTRAGDIFEFEVGPQVRECEVVAVR